MSARWGGRKRRGGKRTEAGQRGELVGEKRSSAKLNEYGEEGYS